MPKDIEAEATCLFDHKVRILLHYDDKGTTINKISCPRINLYDECTDDEKALRAIEGSCKDDSKRGFKICPLLESIENRGRSPWISSQLKVDPFYHLETA